MALSQSGDEAPGAGTGTPPSGSGGQSTAPSTGNAGMGNTNSAGTGNTTNTAGQSAPTGGSGQNQGGSPGNNTSGGTGGNTTPVSGTGGVAVSGTGGTIAGMGGALAGVGGSIAGVGGTLAGVGGSIAGMGGMGGAIGTGDQDAGVPPAHHRPQRNGRRSAPPTINPAASPPAVVGTAAGSGCGPGITIRFKAVVGNDDFACTQSYAAQGSTNTTVKPRDFRFFVQDLALIRNDGKRVPVRLEVRPPWQAKTVALLDFEDHKQECSDGNPELNMQITGTVPAGTYTGLSFVNGVPEDLNHTDPALLPDPLQRYRDLFLDTQRGFRFITADLEADPGDGGGVLHLSSDACAGNPLRCAKPNRNYVEIDNFNVCTDTVLADIGEIFAFSNLAQRTQCVPEGDYCDPIFDAVGVEYATGQPQDGQTAFRRQ